MLKTWKCGFKFQFLMHSCWFLYPWVQVSTGYRQYGGLAMNRQCKPYKPLINKPAASACGCLISPRFIMSGSKSVGSL